MSVALRKGERVVCYGLDPPVGGRFIFRILSCPLPQKPVQKRFLTPKGGSLSDGKAFLKKFSGGGGFRCQRECHHIWQRRHRQRQREGLLGSWLLRRSRLPAASSGTLRWPDLERANAADRLRVGKPSQAYGGRMYRPSSTPDDLILSRETFWKNILLHTASWLF